MSVKVLYVVPPSPSFAGVERVVDNIASQLSVDFQSELDIDVFHSSRYDNVHLKSTSYNLIQGDLKNLRSLLFSIRKVLRQKRYDVVVICQVEPLVICWISKWRNRPKFVLYIHGNPSIEGSSMKSIILFGLLRAFALKSLSGVFGVSRAQLSAFGMLFPSDVKHYYVPNPTRRLGDDASITLKDERAITFVNVGRYCRQKGQDLLLDAFKECFRARSDIRLRLVGFGEDKKLLEKKINDYGLREVVSLDECPSDPGRILAISDIYVSTSRWEGWPLVLCEALQFGLPLIALDCDFGPREIIKSQDYGTVVPLDRMDILTNTMLDYCNNIEREKLKSAARIEYAQSFFVEKVAPIHASALLDVVKGDCAR